MICSGVFCLGGCIVFGLGYNYIAGYSMLALGGMGVQFSAFRVAYAFPDKQSFIIGGISCLFDSSTVRARARWQAASQDSACSASRAVCAVSCRSSSSCLKP